MTAPYEREERIAIISESCHLSQEAAQLMYEKNQFVSENHYADKVARIRSLGTLQKMGKHKIVDGKTLAGNDGN